MYKFALVGCGNIAHRHAENINRVGKLTAVCDIVTGKANALAEKYKARAYYSINELLDNEESADVVVICTPNGLHAEQSIKALQRLKHVLCEKPMCITAEEAQRMIDAADSSHKKLYIVKQNRFNPPVQFVKRLLDEKKLGRLLGFQLNCFWNRPQQYYQDSWRGSKVLDGGLLYTQFSHFIDLLYWFLGDVDDVSGYKKNSGLRSHFELEDMGVANLKMKNGVLGNIHYTINSYKKNLEGSFTIFGEKGSVKIGGQYLNIIEWQSLEEEGHYSNESTVGANDYGFYTGTMSNHHLVYDEFIKALNHEPDSLPSPDEAIKTIEIIEKIYRNSKEF